MPASETATSADTDTDETADTFMLGTRIPAELHDKLNDAATRLSLSKSALTRMALDLGIDNVLKGLGKPPMQP